MWYIYIHYIYDKQSTWLKITIPPARKCMKQKNTTASSKHLRALYLKSFTSLMLEVSSFTFKLSFKDLGVPKSIDVLDVLKVYPLNIGNDYPDDYIWKTPFGGQGDSPRRSYHHVAGWPRSASGWGWWRRVGTTPCCCRRHRPRRAVRSGDGRPHPLAIWSIRSQNSMPKYNKNQQESQAVGVGKILMAQRQGSKHQVVCFAPSARSPFTLPWAWLSTGLHWNWPCVNGENDDPPLELGYPIFRQTHKMIWPTWKRGWSFPCRNRS